MKKVFKTYRGNVVDFERGYVIVDIEDIAHSLALQDRYIGHTVRPYSVAQHSVIVSETVPPEFALWGLLHDAAEAYIGDIIRPIKTTQHKRLEEKFLECIANRFGLSLPIPKEVMDVDDRMLATELASPLIVNQPGAETPYEPYSFHVNPWTDWQDCKLLFLIRFAEITSAE